MVVTLRSDVWHMFVSDPTTLTPPPPPPPLEEGYPALMTRGHGRRVGGWVWADVLLR